ncbi:MAG: hypothetical protein J2P31_15825 [Blastocatellia bacterium]|nr:hypothetical protein [Blastocatellia bacterium]
MIEWVTTWRTTGKLIATRKAIQTSASQPQDRVVEPRQPPAARERFPRNLLCPGASHFLRVGD